MKSRYRRAVFILPYIKTKKGIEYLILRRKLHWKGWEFPKGAIKNKESKKDAARRELKEETGCSVLRIKKFNFSGKYDYNKIFPDRPGIKGQTFSLYAGQVKKGKVKFDKKEHCGHRWVIFSRALKMLKFNNQKKSLRIVNKWLNK